MCSDCTDSTYYQASVNDMRRCVMCGEKPHPGDLIRDASDNELRPNDPLHYPFQSTFYFVHERCDSN